MIQQECEQLSLPSTLFHRESREVIRSSLAIVQCCFATARELVRTHDRLDHFGRFLHSQKSGEKLCPAARSKLESVFHTRFDDVRVQVGPEAASFGALAFTTGSRIFFAPGQYQPTTTHGLRLLGHELAHVVQQKTGRVRHPTGHGVAIVQDPVLEAEAERMGLLASMGETVQTKMADGPSPTEGLAPVGGQSDIFRFGHVVIPDNRRFIILSTKEDAEVIRSVLHVPHIDLAGKDFIENVDCSYDLPGITEEIRAAAAKIPNTGNVLINCLNGRSRSAAAVIAFFLMRRRYTWRSAKARVQRFYDAHRTNRIIADREERFSGCFDKLVGDLGLNTNSIAPMPGGHEIEESIRFRNQFYAQLNHALRRRLAYGIANFPGYRPSG